MFYLCFVRRSILSDILCEQGFSCIMKGKHSEAHAGLEIVDGYLRHILGDIRHYSHLFRHSFLCSQYRSDHGSHAFATDHRPGMGISKQFLRTKDR